MQFYPKRTVEGQANRLPYELRDAYRNSQIDRIKIFDGTNELELTGYAEYSYLEEKSYVTQPVRTDAGSIEELEEYKTFLTPRLIIKYNMMGIDDYRSLMKMLKKQNSFIVRCYDVVEDKMVSNEMYHATPSMPIIYQQYLMALGIKEYTIELIGTNTFKEITFMIDAFNGIHTDKYNTVLGNTWRDIQYENEHFSIDPTGVFFEISDMSGRVYYLDNSNPIYVKPDDFVIEGKIYYVNQ